MCCDGLGRWQRIRGGSSQLLPGGTNLLLGNSSTLTASFLPWARPIKPPPCSIIHTAFGTKVSHMGDLNAGVTGVSFIICFATIAGNRLVIVIQYYSLTDNFFQFFVIGVINWMFTSPFNELFQAVGLDH
ncbi:hypothetical protein KC352_g43316 [Hortaea werneckii]|nr:hypothetical protein KC352_g43316 [Hortaea werneckii]